MIKTAASETGDLFNWLAGYSSSQCTHEMVSNLVRRVAHGGVCLLLMPLVACPGASYC